MSHSAHQSTKKTRGPQGFSMVELLISLMFISLLMSGMAVVFRSAIQSFAATNETFSAHQRNRWSMEMISDDITQAGLIFPDRALPASATSGTESLFKLDADQSITEVMPNDANPSTTTNHTLTADAFQFFLDIPLPVRGTWTSDTEAEAESAEISFTAGGISDLAPGDVMVILDSGEYGQWEHPVIKESAGGTVGNPVVFETDQTVIDNYSGTYTAPGVYSAHPAGVPVYFIRPAQLVRYSVRAIALDPSSSAIKVPCLVRQQASFPISGTVTWSNVTAQIVTENVAGFKVSLSFDGGTTWVRTASSQAGNPTWFRTIPCLIRVDLTTRTSTRREEYSTTMGQRTWRNRTQTLMISPRNFGIGK